MRRRRIRINIFKSALNSDTLQWFLVARILRARGNKGEVAAELWTDFPERLPEIKELFLRAESGTRRAVALRSFWVDRNHPGKGVFHFEGVDSINDAEKLRGLEVQIPLPESMQRRNREIPIKS